MRDSGDRRRIDTRSEIEIALLDRALGRSRGKQGFIRLFGGGQIDWRQIDERGQGNRRCIEELRGERRTLDGDRLGGAGLQFDELRSVCGTVAIYGLGGCGQENRRRLEEVRGEWGTIDGFRFHGAGERDDGRLDELWRGNWRRIDALGLGGCGDGAGRYLERNGELAGG